jgi:hypothetical protein
MLRRPAVLALVSVLLAGGSCAAPGDERAAARGDTNSVQAGTTAAATASQSGLVTAQTQSFDRFWAAFRQAVVAGDKGGIMSVTRFPFETRGESDDDPVKTYNRAQFPALLDTLLAQDAGERMETETMRHFIERTTTAALPPRTAAAADNAGVGTFAFMKIDGRWVFWRAYTGG